MLWPIKTRGGLPGKRKPRQRDAELTDDQAGIRLGALTAKTDSKRLINSMRRMGSKASTLAPSGLSGGPGNSGDGIAVAAERYGPAHGLLIG